MGVDELVTGGDVDDPVLDSVTTGDVSYSENSSMIHDRDKVTSTTATTDGSGYYLVDSDAAGAAVTLTLATADAVEGRELNVKRDGQYDVTIATEGSETIDGESSITITNDQASVTLVYNSADSDWEVW